MPIGPAARIGLALAGAAVGGRPLNRVALMAGLLYGVRRQTSDLCGCRLLLIGSLCLLGYIPGGDARLRVDPLVALRHRIARAGYHIRCPQNPALLV